jgi:hypothetical protein
MGEHAWRTVLGNFTWPCHAQSIVAAVGQDGLQDPA